MSTSAQGSFFSAFDKRNNTVEADSCGSFVEPKIRAAPDKDPPSNFGGGGHLLDSLGSKVQCRLLVLGLARQAVLPGEPQHVLHRVVDAQSAGVVERGAALAVLAGQQDLHAVVLKGWTHQGHTQKTQKVA